ncbi:glycosyltransferase family 2 protein [Flavobacterium sp. CFS9]|uniref:Glycosyltransferase family 2 protein n=1 Tax=Flavobacterium sp. CFS9 TaxID=3143118 RepID=A0AAT9GYK7_9FLAO
MIENNVSIIMPSYKSERFITKSIESVLNQTHKNWELIIIDDCSPDNSLQIIKEYCNIDSRIRLVTHEKNSGVAESRNRGIKEAKFPYIAFLDSDDLWEENKLEVQLNFMEQNKAAISFTQYYRINEVDEKIGEVNRIPDTVSYFDLLKGNVIAMSTSMMDMRVVEKIKFEKIGHEDYLFWLMALKSGPIALGINLKLVHYRVHSTSLSSNKLKAVTYTWHIYREWLNLNIIGSAYYFFIHEFNAVRKRLQL